jgi:predicted MFS family arabinose efflux permease
MGDLGINSADIGWMMSLFNFTGLILALPCGFICLKFGIKRTILFAVGSIVIGSSIGTLATDITLLYISRLIEGIGMGLISVAAPAGIVPWFTSEKRGLPLSIWTFWMPLATLLLFNTAPTLSNAFGWRFVFGAVTGFSLIMLIVVAIFFKLPEEAEKNVSVGFGDSIMAIVKELKNRNIWLIGLGFCFFNLATPGVIGSFYPSFLELEGGFTNTQASSLTSIVTIFGMTSPAIGWLCDRTGKAKLIMIISNIVIAILFLFVFQITALGMIIPLLGFTGILIPGFCAPARLLSTQITGSSPAQASVAMAILSLFQNLGSVLGSAIFGVLLLSVSWATAGYLVLLPTLLLSLLMTILMRTQTGKS